ncbi:MAG TPA: tetratricopeptide repeat protein [Blastocatellia bacterium]|nr:tetratricopeptide repeat protein [Blastocatellia bacterium]
MNRKHSILVIAGLAALAVSMSGCILVNKLRAKNNLNDGVRDFNNGHYEQAQDLFAFALSLDPDNANAQLYYARALNARFEQKQTEDLGLKAIDAYETIIAHKHNDDPGATDKALAFEAIVYNELAAIKPDKADEYKDKGRDALSKRADLPSATANTKAQVYYTIGDGYWDEAYHLSSPYAKPVAGQTQQQKIPPEVIAKMKPLLVKAHEYLTRAIALKPDYGDAWAIQKLTYIQDLSVERSSEGPPAAQTEILARIKEADETARKLYAQQKQEAAQAASSPGQ